MNVPTMHELAQAACPAACSYGPCAECYLAARRILLRLTGAGVVPLHAARQITDPIPHGEPA